MFSEHVVSFFRRRLLLRHGTPCVILSDRGTPFTSSLFCGELEHNGIRHGVTSQHRPQTNGLVERANRTISGILHSYVNLHHTNWDEFGPFAAFAMNTAQQATTGVSPYQLVHRRLPVLPHEGTSGAAWELWDCPMPSLLQQRLQDALTGARTATHHAQERMDAAFSRTAVPALVGPGDLVLVRWPLRVWGRAEKLLPRFQGPCEVVCQLGPVTFQLRDWDITSSCRNRLFTPHRAHMKPYVGWESLLSTQPVA